MLQLSEKEGRKDQNVEFVFIFIQASKVINCLGSSITCNYAIIIFSCSHLKSHLEKKKWIVVLKEIASGRASHAMQVTLNLEWQRKAWFRSVPNHRIE